MDTVTFPEQRGDTSPWAIFMIFLRLGLSSFGGPIAHLGYFRAEFVTRRRWLSDRGYAELVALCQFLPGPASSQVGMALGLMRAGHTGALAAWLGFTLPSALALMLFARGLAHYGAALAPGLLHGLKLVAVAVVAQAVWGMARTLCTDPPRVALMAAACALVLWLPGTGGQLGAILLAAGAGLLLFGRAPAAEHEPLPVAPGRRAGALWLGLFGLLLVGLPLVAQLSADRTLALLDAFYRAGALVFGGGHVVLPLLQAAVVATGWVDNDTFLAGYGAAQAVPGPLFSFAAFLGAAIESGHSPWLNGALCLLAIFAPGFLLVAGALPFWERLRRNRRVRAALAGVNAAVVGLLLAALYRPVWSSAVGQPRDVALVLLALAALMWWKLPPWLVVLGCGLLGWLLPYALP